MAFIGFRLTGTYYHSDKAIAQSFVDTLNGEGDDLRYELGESPRGYYIKVYDENGNVLGDL